MNELFLDLETGGIDERRHPITEVAVLDAGGALLLHRLVTFDVARASSGALDLNGYDESLWAASARPWSEVASELATLFSRSPKPVLVGHYAHFDHRFLREHMREAGYDPDLVPTDLVDTRALAHEHLGGLRSRSLAFLARVLGLVPKGPIHRAVQDADLARRAYLRMRRAGPFRRFWWRARAYWFRRTP